MYSIAPLTLFPQHLTRDHGTFFNMNLVLIINLLEKSQLLRLISKIKGEGDEEERRRRNNKDVQVFIYKIFKNLLIGQIARFRPNPTNI